MRALVIGGGNIGPNLAAALVADGHRVLHVTRAHVDMRDVPHDVRDRLGDHDVVFICAAKTKFIDCESDPDAYRVNVDGPIEIAKRYKDAKVVYLSSEAVERGLHTNYGMHKALTEIGLRAVCDPTIARIAKVDKDSMSSVCGFLVGLAKKNPGVYRWRSA